MNVAERLHALAAFTDEARRRKFRPGAWDCALFAAEWVYRVTGIDHAEPWRGTYSSMKAGQDALRAAGHDDHLALIAARLEEIPPAFAQIGDLAVIGPDAMGVVAGEFVFVLRRDGLASMPLTAATRAFKVA